MRPSNRLFISFLNALALLVLSACSLGKPGIREDAPQDAASFYVEKTSVSVTSQETDADISLPTAKIFSFKACMKESQHSQIVANHLFLIHGGAEEQSATSDASGCVTWSEKIKYNHLAEAHWVQALRSLQAKGLQTGQRRTTWALNPWEDQAESLAEKKIPDIIEAGQAESALNAESKQGIWIDDLRLTIDEKRVSEEGVVLNVEIRTQPSWPVLKTRGRRILEPITKGSFSAEILLINALTENGKEVHRPASRALSVQGQIVNNALLLESDKLILPSSARYGQIQLALKIKALGGPKNLATFEGVFNIGEYDQMKGNFFSRLKNIFEEKQGSYKLAEYLTDTQTPAPPLGTDSSILSKDPGSPVSYQKSQVQIPPLEFASIGFRQSGSARREKIFTVSACFLAPLDSKPLRAQSFDVQKVNGGKETLRSNDRGCITWEDSLAFDYLQPECWLSKAVQITNANFSMKQNLTLLINPWSEGFSAARDARQVGQQELQCASGKSKIVILRYDFNKKSVDYPIDRFLNIQVKKDGILKLQPRLKRPSLVDPTGFEDTPLPAGKYLLRWAVVDHSTPPEQKVRPLIYQAEEKTVQVDVGGTIAESISLESSNLKALGNTNDLIIEVSPLEANTNLTSAVYRGPIVLSNADEGANMELLDESENSQSWFSTLQAQLKKDREEQHKLQEQLSRKESFAANENLTILNLNDDKAMNAFVQILAQPIAWRTGREAEQKQEQLLSQELKQELKEWQKTGKFKTDLAGRFCTFWFYHQFPKLFAKAGDSLTLTQTAPQIARLTQACQQDSKGNIKKYFDLQYRYFMKDATKIKNLTTEIKDLTFNSSFSLSQTHDDSVTKTFSADVSAGLSTSKWMSPFSIAGGFRYQVAHAQSNRQGMANSSVFQSGESLQMEKLNFLIQASSYEKCSVLRLNPEILSSEQKPLLQWLSQRMKPGASAALQQEKLHQELTRGFLLCDGEVQTRPVKFTESYFVLNQKNPYTQVIDSSSDLGRPLFMAVRGLNDFRRLLQMLGGQVKAPGSSSLEIQAQNTRRSGLAPVFSGRLPTYPGQYVADE